MKPHEPYTLSLTIPSCVVSLSDSSRQRRCNLVTMPNSYLGIHSLSDGEMVRSRWPGISYERNRDGVMEGKRGAFMWAVR